MSYLTMEWQDGRESTGFLPSPIATSPPTSPHVAPGSAVNSSLGPEDFSIGRSSSPSVRRRLWPSSPVVSGRITPSSLGPLPRLPMSGRRTPELPEPNLNWESSRSTATRSGTGMLFGSAPSPATLRRSPLRFVYRVIELSEPYAQTIKSRLEWSGLVMFSGVELAVESRGMLGRQPETTLTVKIRGQSSGADMIVKSVLSLMNLEEVLTSVTYSDGLTDTRSLWRLKDLPYLSVPKRSGSPAISTQETGTLN